MSQTTLLKKSFECKICKMSFTHHGSLHNHMRTHFNDRPFTCKICKNTFKWKHSLKMHMTIHQRRNEITFDQCNEDLSHQTYAAAIKNSIKLEMNKSSSFSRQNKDTASFNSKKVEHQPSWIPVSQLNSVQPLQQVLVQNQWGQNNYAQFRSGHSEYQKIGTTSKLDGSIVMMTPIKLENRTPNIQMTANYSTFSPFFQHGFPGKLQQQIHSYASELAKTYYSSVVNCMMNQQYCLKLNPCQLNNNNHQEFI